MSTRCKRDAKSIWRRHAVRPLLTLLILRVLVAFAAAQHAIALAFASIHSGSTSPGGLGDGAFTTRYLGEMARVEEDVRPEWESLWREVVLTPVTKFAAYFPRVDALVAKRARKLIDLDAARSRVKAEVEKPSKDAGKLPQVTYPTL